MFRQILFMVLVGMLAVIVGRTAYAGSFSDVVAPQAVDAVVLDLPADDR